MIQICKRNYGYPICYRAMCGEADLVPWENPVFESVGVDAYVQKFAGLTEDWILALFSRLKTYGKPVYSTEAGCLTFTGAGRVGGNELYGVWESQPYDEDEQANYIKRYCEMLNRARINGYFYTLYNDVRSFDKGYGLLNGRKGRRGSTCTRATSGSCERWIVVDFSNMLAQQQRLLEHQRWDLIIFSVLDPAK